MPSVFTIEGTDVPPPRKRARKAPLDTPPASPRKRTPKAQLEGPPEIGFCKTVRNPRTGCEMQLCYVGVGATTKSGKKSRTGWTFKPGSSRCPRR